MLTFRKFWRGRARVVVRRRFFRVPRAIISSSATIVKSFLRQYAQIFSFLLVFWRRRADYTVVVRRCQVLFAQKEQIFPKRSLGGAPIIQYGTDAVKYNLGQLYQKM